VVVEESRIIRVEISCTIVFVGNGKRVVLLVSIDQLGAVKQPCLLIKSIGILFLSLAI
jgi:hypothetical protein